MPYQVLFLEGLGITTAIELTVGIVLRILEQRFNIFGHKTLSAIPWLQFILSIVLANILTVPYVWFVFPYFLKPKLFYIIIAELFAWFMEALFYYYSFRLKAVKAIIFSFILNLCSFLLGLLIVFK